MSTQSQCGRVRQCCTYFVSPNSSATSIPSTISISSPSPAFRSPSVTSPVDLEHNQYRSFQGLTCLMQISTRTEDFIVDTLKLRIHIGPPLREVFKDPSKRKASKLLKLERNSLEHLLHHFCEVTVNKEYQNADRRLGPLPDEMIRNRTRGG